MKLSLSQAAIAAHKNKGQISKALTTGKLSGEKLSDGSWSIESAELQRWLNATRPRGNGKPDLPTLETHQKKLPETIDLITELAAVRERLKVVEVERDRERETLSGTIEDLRARLDAESSERRRLSERLLAAPVPEPVAAAPETAPVRGGWIARLFG